MASHPDPAGTAEKLCSGCPLMRECAKAGLERIDANVGNRAACAIFNEGQVDSGTGEFRDVEPVALVEQSGVVLAGVVVDGSPEARKALSERAGVPFDPTPRCVMCARPIYKRRAPVESRPPGAVQEARGGACASCARGAGGGSNKGSRSRLASGARSEALRLYRQGRSPDDIAQIVGLHKRTVQRFIAEARGGA